MAERICLLTTQQWRTTALAPARFRCFTIARIRLVSTYAIAIYLCLTRTRYKRRSSVIRSGRFRTGDIYITTTITTWRFLILPHLYRVKQITELIWSGGSSTRAISSIYLIITNRHSVFEVNKHKKLLLHLNSAELSQHLMLTRSRWFNLGSLLEMN